MTILVATPDCIHGMLSNGGKPGLLLVGVPQLPSEICDEPQYCACVCTEPSTAIASSKEVKSLFMIYLVFLNYLTKVNGFRVNDQCF